MEVQNNYLQMKNIPMNSVKYPGMSWLPMILERTLMHIYTRDATRKKPILK